MESYALLGSSALLQFVDELPRDAAITEFVGHTEVDDAEAGGIGRVKEVTGELPSVGPGAEHSAVVDMIVERLAWKEAKGPAVSLHQLIDGITVGGRERRNRYIHVYTPLRVARVVAWSYHISSFGSSCNTLSGIFRATSTMVA